MVTVDKQAYQRRGHPTGAVKWQVSYILTET
jgi:hypothetical protein